MSEIANRALIAFCALLVVWYILGWQMNRSRGDRLLGLVLQNLRAFSDQITVSRLGTSGFQVNVEKAPDPLRKVEATILLQPREIFLIWILDILRGRTDSLILKGTLRAWPRGEVEVIKRGRLSGRGLEELDGEDWTRQEPSAGLVVACRGEKGRQQADALLPLLEGLAPRLLRLSLSKKTPHLLVSLSLAELDERSARLVFTSLQELAQAATSRDH